MSLHRLQHAKYAEYMQKNMHSENMKSKTAEHA